MATIVSIKQKIEQLDAGSFQVLCDAYLSREGYPNPVSLGTKAGTQKTTQGTPDTYFCLANGKYVLAEYTTQQTGLVGKVRADLEKCFDSKLSGINNDDITEIIYCHTSSIIDAGADKSLKRYCQDKGVQLTMIGIDKLAEDISRKYPILAKEHLGLSVDTEQIQDPLDFVRQYDASALAAPLNTNFLFRENEIVRLQKAFDENNVVILSGAAGTGKTRLALEFAERFQKEHTAVKICVIHNHGLPIYDDLKQHFECPGDYFVIVDDANQLSQLDLIIEYVNKKDNGYNVRILATVRNYALQKVKADIAGIVHYSEVTLDSLSDDEIKSLVKDYLGIINRDYLNRIATIAEGNARIALIAGKVAVDANGLQSISDVTGLYEEYYGKAFKEANLDGDLQLQITAGVIAFLGSIHLDHIEPVLNLLVGYNIDISVFKSCAYKLHEMELVDICRDKAVAISDQCFANYILKHVFVDKKTISLAQMLDTCFQTYRERTIQAVNTLLGVFQSQDVYDFTIHEIKVVWKKRKSESFNKYWDWVKAFYQVDQVETLLLIKERIDNTEKVELSVDEIDVNEGKNYQSVDDELIVILGGFADTHNIESALDLFFDYYLKRPDLYIQFYHATNLYFGIKPSSLQKGFYTQIQLIQHFINYSDNWNNPFIRILFFETAKNLLQVYFSPAEAGRRGDSFVIYHFSLPTTEQAVMYRKLIWEQLLAIQGTIDSKESIRALLQDYARSVEESSFGLIKEDAPYICELFQSVFSPESVTDCILAEHVNSILSVVGYTAAEIEVFLKSRKLSIYHILIGPRWENFKSLDRHENEHKRVITDYFTQAENTLDAFNELFEVYREYIACDTQRLYDIGKGLMEGIKYLSRDSLVFSNVVKRIIESGIIEGIDVHYIISTLFTLLSPEEVKTIIHNAPSETVDFWLFAYYCEIPSEAIDAAKVEELYAYLKCDYDREIHTAGYRSLKFLERYESVESDIIINAARLIFAKKDYSPFIVNIYFSLIFNRHHCEPKSVIQKFAKDLQLLEEIYLFESVHDRLADADGAFLKELCCCRKAFAKDYIDTLLKDNHHRLHDDNEKLHALFECPDFIDIIDLLVDGCSQTSFPLFDYPPVMKTFIFVPDNIKHKSDAWIKHYISKYNTDYEKMESLFSVLSELCDDRKKDYISYLMTVNADPELFRRIPLCPTSYSWSGSAVPLYSKWADYLKGLLPLFSGIQFLQHQKVVNDEIEHLSKMIERAEIEDLLQG